MSGGFKKEKLGNGWGTYLGNQEGLKIHPTRTIKERYQSSKRHAEERDCGAYRYPFWK